MDVYNTCIMYLPQEVYIYIYNIFVTVHEDMGNKVSQGKITWKTDTCCLCVFTCTYYYFYFVHYTSLVYFDDNSMWLISCGVQFGKVSCGKHSLDFHPTAVSQRFPPSHIA